MLLSGRSVLRPYMTTPSNIWVHSQCASVHLPLVLQQATLRMKGPAQGPNGLGVENDLNL